MVCNFPRMEDMPQFSRSSIIYDDKVFQKNFWCLVKMCCGLIDWSLFKGYWSKRKTLSGILMLKEENLQFLSIFTSLGKWAERVFPLYRAFGVVWGIFEGIALIVLTKFSRKMEQRQQAHKSLNFGWQSFPLWTYWAYRGSFNRLRLTCWRPSPNREGECNLQWCWCSRGACYLAGVSAAYLSWARWWHRCGVASEWMLGVSLAEFPDRRFVWRTAQAFLLFQRTRPNNS